MWDLFLQASSRVVFLVQGLFQFVHEDKVPERYFFVEKYTACNCWLILFKAENSDKVYIVESALYKVYTNTCKFLYQGHALITMINGNAMFLQFVIIDNIFLWDCKCSFVTNGINSYISNHTAPQGFIFSNADSIKTFINNRNLYSYYYEFMYMTYVLLCACLYVYQRQRLIYTVYMFNCIPAGI